MGVECRRNICTLMLVSLLLLGFGGGWCLASDHDMDGEMMLRMEHSLDMGETWESRGSLAFSKSRSSVPSINQGSMSEESLSKLESLCSNNQLYLIKVYGEGIGDLQSYTPACAMLSSSLAEQITLFLDWRGNPIAANLAARNSFGKKANIQKFDTRIQVQSMENGPTPDTAAYIQKMEEEKSRKISGKTEDNRSFFAKYWMYIVPLCVIMLMNSAGGPEGGGAR